MKKTAVLLFSLAFCMGSLSARGQSWGETNSWLGRAPTTTRVFRLVGNRCRLHYINHGPGPLRIRMFDRDHRKVYEVYTQRNVPGIRTIPNDGEYYLVIEPTNSRWEVSIQQRLTRGQEWQLRQEALSIRQRQARLASFSGGPGSFAYPLSVPPGSWRLVYSNNQDGSLDIEVQGGNGGGEPFVSRLRSPQRTDTWFHRDGEFSLRVEAEETRWRIDLYHLAEDDGHDR